MKIEKIFAPPSPIKVSYLNVNAEQSGRSF